MIEITFEEFDQWEEEVKGKIKPGFVLPLISEIEKLIKTNRIKQGVELAFMAQLVSKDKNYNKKINKLLNQYIRLVDETEDMNHISILSLTFAEYDEIEEAAEEVKAPKIPSWEFGKYLTKENLLYLVAAKEQTKYADYKKEIEEYLRKHLILVEDATIPEDLAVEEKSSKKKMISAGKIKEIKSITDDISGDITYNGFPELENIVKFVKGDTEEEIAYLLWILEHKQAETEQDSICKQYIQNLIQKRCS